MTDAPLAPRRPMDDNKGLGEGMTSVDIYCHRQHKGQWQQEADKQGISLSRNVRLPYYATVSPVTGWVR